MSEHYPRPPVESIVREIQFLGFLDGGLEGQVWKVREISGAKRILAAKIFCCHRDERNERRIATRKQSIQKEVRIVGEFVNRYKIDLYYPLEEFCDLVDMLGSPVDGYTIGLTMELSVLGNLRKFVQSTEFQNRSNIEKIRLLRRVAEAVNEMHNKKLTHGDIKPSNILMFDQGAGGFIPKIADFGFAFYQGETPSKGGTPAYIAPEIVLHEASCSEKTDVFSLGVTFKEALSGVNPLDAVIGNSQEQRKVLLGWYRTHPRFDHLPLSIADPQLAEIIDEMCEFDPGKRILMSEVFERLTNLENRFASSANFIRPKYAKIPGDRFHWNPAIYEKFSAKRHIVFLGGADPVEDIDWLAKRLHEERIFGFSIVVVLGGKDYILHAWISEGAKVRLLSVLDDYKRRNGYVGEKHVVIRTLPARRLAKRYSAASADQLLLMIDDLASRGDFSETAKTLKTEKLITHELSEEKNFLRAFVKIEFSRELDELELDTLLPICETALDEARRRKELVRYEVLRFESKQSLLAILDFKNYYEYEKIFDSLCAPLRDKLLGKKERVSMSTATYLELNKRNRYESYDNGILDRLSRIEAAR